VIVFARPGCASRRFPNHVRYWHKADIPRAGRMFRSCVFLVRLARMRFGTERMRHVLRKILVFALSVGLTASAPALSHAQPGHSGAAASHENHDVQHYADLAIEPGDDGCPHSASGTTHDQDEGLCKKCCAACLGASLIPAIPLAVWALSVARDTLLTRHDILIARPVPTEPGIPKPI
jgi:hypothetical protein